jgi:hypothetical protein
VYNENSVKVRKILRENPNLDVNRELMYGRTALHAASLCRSGTIIELLLGHPDIDVNKKSDLGEAPLSLSNREKIVVGVKLLLQDARTRIIEPEDHGRIRLWYPAAHGSEAIITWWMASGRELGLGMQEKDWAHALDYLVSRNTREWIEDYKANPENAREEARRRLVIKEFPLITPVTQTRERYDEFLDGKILLDGTVLSAEERLFAAVEEGDVGLVGQLLRECPRVDINWRKEARYSSTAALPTACLSGDLQMIALLLTHPDIDVNVRTGFEGRRNPFSILCEKRHIFCLRFLLQDPRVIVSPAAAENSLEIMMLLIASGKELDLGILEPEKGDGEDHEVPEGITLLERFRDHPEETRREARVVTGWFDEAASEVFALVVFLCDGILRVKEETQNVAARFFKIAQSLPLELQMVLCYRVVGSGAVNIPGAQREEAFRSLAPRIIFGLRFFPSSFP